MQFARRRISVSREALCQRIKPMFECIKYFFHFFFFFFQVDSSVCVCVCVYAAQVHFILPLLHFLESDFVLTCNTEKMNALDRNFWFFFFLLLLPILWIFRFCSCRAHLANNYNINKKKKNAQMHSHLFCISSVRALASALLLIRCYTNHSLLYHIISTSSSWLYRGIQSNFIYIVYSNETK